MKLKSSYLFYSICFLFSIASLSAQEQKVDEKKIQEVINMQADPVTLPPNEDGSLPVDTNPPKGMAASEILKRAVNFMKIESVKYSKSNALTTGSKAECVVTFKYKPKELNPKADVQGSIKLHLSIDAKEGKYRYTISKITHNALNSEFSGGDIFSDVPACGSLNLPLDLWKRIRGEANQKAAVIAADLKEAMKVSSIIPVNADEW